MAQFCRYCDHVSVPGMGMAFCEARNVLMSRDHLRHTNNCDHFDYNPIDALRQHRPGHQPRDKGEDCAEEQVPGQTSIYDYLQEDDA